MFGAQSLRRVMARVSWLSLSTSWQVIEIAVLTKVFLAILSLRQEAKRKRKKGKRKEKKKKKKERKKKKKERHGNGKKKTERGKGRRGYHEKKE